MDDCRCHHSLTVGVSRQAVLLVILGSGAQPWQACWLSQHVTGLRIGSGTPTCLPQFLAKERRGASVLEFRLIFSRTLGQEVTRDGR